MIRNDILQKFPDLFGAKKVNGRDVNVQEAITTLTLELRPEIAAALSARRQILESPAPVREKYAWPKWEEQFEDPIKGGTHVSPDRARVGGQFPGARERVALAIE